MSNHLLDTLIKQTKEEIAIRKEKLAQHKKELLDYTKQHTLKNTLFPLDAEQELRALYIESDVIQLNAAIKHFELKLSHALTLNSLEQEQSALETDWQYSEKTRRKISIITNQKQSVRATIELEAIQIESDKEQQLFQIALRTLDLHQLIHEKDEKSSYQDNPDNAPRDDEDRNFYTMLERQRIEHSHEQTLFSFEMERKQAEYEQKRAAQKALILESSDVSERSIGIEQEIREINQTLDFTLSQQTQDENPLKLQAEQRIKQLQFDMKQIKQRVEYISKRNPNTQDGRTLGMEAEHEEMQQYLKSIEEQIQGVQNRLELDLKSFEEQNQRIIKDAELECSASQEAHKNREDSRKQQLAAIEEEYQGRVRKSSQDTQHRRDELEKHKKRVSDNLEQTQNSYDRLLLELELIQIDAEIKISAEISSHDLTISNLWMETRKQAVQQSPEDAFRQEFIERDSIQLTELAFQMKQKQIQKDVAQNTFEKKQQHEELLAQEQCDRMRSSPDLSPSRDEEGSKQIKIAAKLNKQRNEHQHKSSLKSFDIEMQQIASMQECIKAHMSEMHSILKSDNDAEFEVVRINADTKLKLKQHECLLKQFEQQINVEVESLELEIEDIQKAYPPLPEQALQDIKTYLTNYIEVVKQRYQQQLQYAEAEKQRILSDAEIRIKEQEDRAAEQKNRALAEANRVTDNSIQDLKQSSAANLAHIDGHLQLMIEMLTNLRGEIDDVSLRKIDVILGEFNNRIQGIDKPIYEKSHHEATQLLNALQESRNTYETSLRMPLSNKAEAARIFVKACESAINKAKPVLENDLGWKDYLANLFKALANAIIGIFSSNRNVMFKPHEPTSYVALKDVEAQLNLGSHP